MKTQRIPLMFDPEMVERIDDHRHANRIGSRAEAIRQLIEKGLGEERVSATGGVSPKQSPVADRNTTDQEIDHADRR